MLSISTRIHPLDRICTTCEKNKMKSEQEIVVLNIFSSLITLKKSVLCYSILVSDPEGSTQMFPCILPFVSDFLFFCLSFYSPLLCVCVHIT